MLASSHTKAALCLAALLCCTAAAQTPLTGAFNYQGELAQAGQPFSGDADFEFSLYDAAEAGSQVGASITFLDVSILSGVFTVPLNAGGEFGVSAFNGQQRWLQISVNGTPLTPRQPLNATPHAQFAVRPWQTNGSSIYYNGGNVGIGQDFPGHRLEVRTISGNAVHAINTAGTGATYGVWGQANSLSGTGVFGSAPTASSAVNSGVHGSSAGTNGRGVFGTATATSGSPYGVRGEAHAANGAGVYATNDATAGVGAGIHAVSTSPSGSGVYARANYSAVNGQTNGTSGAGVLGFASAAGGTTYGVWGFASDAADYGVYSNGRTGATGTKSFRIDHPLDPAGKYLSHYCAEGPEPLNVYSGTVTTDARGEAWVVLPDYFEAVNRDFRYGLTVVDDTDSAEFVQAKIAREISDNRFKIRTSAAHMKVSWEIKAVRDDAWVRAYGAPVETEKTGEERGRYQHPELYGQPPELGLLKRPESESAAAPMP